MPTNGTNTTGSKAPDGAPDSATENRREDGAATESGMEAFATDTLNLLNEHKGKLAFGAAAALGLMILYNWREKSLAEEDPEDYARLQKFTAPFKTQDELEQEEFERRMRDEERRAAGR